VKYERGNAKLKRARITPIFRKLHHARYLRSGTSCSNPLIFTDRRPTNKCKVRYKVIADRTVQSSILSAPLNSLMKLNRDSRRHLRPGIYELKYGRKSSMNSRRALFSLFSPAKIVILAIDSAGISRESRVVEKKEQRERERENCHAIHS